MIRKFIFLLLTVSCYLSAEPPEGESGIRKIHLIQDDAQDYMVSKIYTLKYAQSNDLAPFVTGMVMRYNINSSVGTIEYGADNTQLLTVTCPIEMMPCVDDFIAKADRNIPLSGKEPGEIVKGTGITRAVYRPKYRSGQNLLNVLVNSVIGEGPYSSVYAWDQNSNQIYWKDNSSNTEYVYQFLGYLDRPAPQIQFEFVLYEVRESTLRDIGIEYLSWKNGPGLNIFQAAFRSFSINSGGTSALQAMSGPMGAFFAAPQFDASFIRLLEQNGTAEIRDTATLTVSNSDSSVNTVYFSPEFQNIVKNDNDKTSVGSDSLGLQEGFYQAMLKITAPIVNLHYGDPQEGYPENEDFSVQNYQPGEYSKYKGTVNFTYTLQSAYVVDRNNVGAELVETNDVTSSVLIGLGKEFVLARWEKDQLTEQTIGVPFLSDIPILKYLFSTETVQKEKTNVYLTVKAVMLNTAVSSVLPDVFSGELKKVGKAKHE
jgi:type II secretory pathway component GspD/PulD (secretin)